MYYYHFQHIKDTLIVNINNHITLSKNINIIKRGYFEIFLLLLFLSFIKQDHLVIRIEVSITFSNH